MSEYTKNYTVENDPVFQDFKDNKRNLSKNTLRCYRDSLNMFCRANEETLENIYNTCNEEQVDEIINGKIHKFSPNTPSSSIKSYFNRFINTCLKTDENEPKSKPNKPSTINGRVRDIRVFFNSVDIELPNWEPFKEDKKKWTLLTKDDINFVMNDVTLSYKALITFLLSTGMRESDASLLTIGDFMKATGTYHNFKDVEDFIDNAPQDMKGYWNFEPQKTKRYDVNCKTFNSMESSNYILQNLRRIKDEYIPRANREKKLNLKIEKSSALFGSRGKNFLGHMRPQGITDSFTQKNKKLRAYHISKIDQKIEKGEISAEDRDEFIEKIPRFHPHALRKYFSTTINSYGDYRTCLVLEGHKSKIHTDDSYVKIKKDDVEKVYNKALKDLTIEPIDPKLITDTEAEELKQQINDLTKELKKEKKENSELKTELNAMKTSQTNIQTQMSTIQNQMDTIEKNVLGEDIIEFKKALSENDYIKEDGTLMELVMLLYKDYYKHDEPIISMKSLADELASRAYIRKRNDIEGRKHLLKVKYGDKYFETRQEFESIRDGYFEYLNSEKIPKTWVIRIDEEILKSCEYVLKHEQSIDAEKIEFYEIIEDITGLKYADYRYITNELEKKHMSFKKHK